MRTPIAWQRRSPMVEPLKVLDLFAGTGSSTQAFRDRGHEVVRIELDGAHEADLWADVTELWPNDDILDHHWDFIWASPPCTCFSLAGISHHFEVKDGAFIPRHEDAEQALNVVAHTRMLIEELEPVAAIMENPRATLRKMPVVVGLDRTTVWYCQYGDHAAKPTDLWLFGAAKQFHFRPGCKNNSPTCHHERAPRGSKTGTQGKQGSKERSRVPYELSLDLCIQVEDYVAGRFTPGRIAS